MAFTLPTYRFQNMSVATNIGTYRAVDCGTEDDVTFYALECTFPDGTRKDVAHMRIYDDENAIGECIRRDIYIDSGTEMIIPELIYAVENSKIVPSPYF